jgi:hypothetical protein
MLTTYLISYFVINFILGFKIIKNVYFTPHTEEYLKEKKEEISFFIPLTLLFGTALFIIAYFDEMINGE